MVLPRRSITCFPRPHLGTYSDSLSEGSGIDLEQTEMWISILPLKKACGANAGGAKAGNAPSGRGTISKVGSKAGAESRAVWPVSSGRKRRTSGSTLVEGMLMLLPTLALIFGFADVSLMLFRWSTLQNAVREGARYAITFQRSGSLGQDDSIKKIVEQYAMGFVKSSNTPATIFVNYFSTSALTTAISCDTHVSGCTAAGGNVPGNLVEVSASMPFSWLAPLSGTYGSGSDAVYSSTALTIKTYSSDILGGYPAGVSSVTR